MDIVFKPEKMNIKFTPEKPKKDNLVKFKPKKENKDDSKN